MPSKQWEALRDQFEELLKRKHLNPDALTDPALQEFVQQLLHPIIRPHVVRYCKDCGAPTEHDATHIYCTPCNAAEQLVWEQRQEEDRLWKEKQDKDRKQRRAEKRAEADAEAASSGEENGTEKKKRTPRPNGNGDRAVLTVKGKHADKARRIAMNKGKTLSEVGVAMVATLPQKEPRPKPSVDKDGEGSATICVYGADAERVQEVRESWGWKLSHLAVWMVEALEE
jgi:hypothetical protein